MAMTTSPTPKTSAAQIAPPRSPGGRAGHIHGVSQPALSASSAKAKYASGPIQESEPPNTAAESKPTPLSQSVPKECYGAAEKVRCGGSMTC